MLVLHFFGSSYLVITIAIGSLDEISLLLNIFGAADIDNMSNREHIKVKHIISPNNNIHTSPAAFVGFHAGQMHVYFSQRVTEEGRNHPSTANGFYGFLFGLAG